VLDLDQRPPLDAYLLLARTASSLGRGAEAEIFVLDYLAQGGSPDMLVSRGQSTGSPPRGEIR
jgi:hypothetical protein